MARPPSSRYSCRPWRLFILTLVSGVAIVPQPCRGEEATCHTEPHVVLGYAKDHRPVCLVDEKAILAKGAGGDWGPGWESRCAFVDMRRVKALEKKFGADHAAMATPNAFVEALLQARALKSGQRPAETCHILLVGDSITHQVYSTMECLLQLDGVPTEGCVKKEHGHDPVDAFLRSHGRGYTESYAERIRQHPGYSSWNWPDRGHHFSFQWPWQRGRAATKTSAHAAADTDAAEETTASTTVHVNFIEHAGDRERGGPGWVGGAQYGLPEEPFDSLLRNISGCGVLIYNQGVHVGNATELRQNLENVMGRAEAIMREDKSGLLTVFRETLAQHFVPKRKDADSLARHSGSYNGAGHSGTDTDSCWAGEIHSESNMLTTVADQALAKYPAVKVARAWELSAPWHSLHTHPEGGDKLDCTHYHCFSQVFWKLLWRSLLTALPSPGNTHGISEWVSTRGG